MYPILNSLRNIRRQYRRYRILVPLILICAVLTGIFMTVAVPCRLYTDGRSLAPPDFAAEDAELLAKQDERVRELGESASMLQFGVSLIGAAAILYVSSLMIGERLFDVGILYSIGLSRGQIFLSLVIELTALCGITLITGLTLGRLGAILYLKHGIAGQILPAQLTQYMNGGISGLLCVITAVCILLLPVLGLAVKLMKTDPNGFLRERK